MALKIRLRQQGRKNRQTYRLVLTESRSPRDGKYIEALGWYNPFEKETEKNVNIQEDRVSHWLSQGAIISQRAEALLKRSCPQVVEMYKKKILAKQAKMHEKRKGAKSEGTKKTEPKKEVAEKAPKAAPKAKAAPKKPKASA